ncbi:hypothetical protein BC939DRAFT_455752 [Gamsiella multidivaricata]|uniref:uncharacterized protein n=1 Tax=Gamsiella multidivaricata TaxID=101098 RepID=UPI00221EACD6|nr:uncharacterized protein BC939DRAFT_455752 [Gamsiella multidivaricata]KAI7821341.1 hypothetical protein BC939DRAFT_455752 [Gamsiella multidivaricata]
MFIWIEEAMDLVVVGVEPAGADALADALADAVGVLEASQWRMGVKPEIPAVASPIWVELHTGVAPLVHEEAAPVAVNAVVDQWQTQARVAGFWMAAAMPVTLRLAGLKLSVSSFRSAALRVEQEGSLSNEPNTHWVQVLLSKLRALTLATATAARARVLNCMLTIKGIVRRSCGGVSVTGR